MIAALPNKLTLSRLVLAPVYAYCALQDGAWWLGIACIITVAAFVSDLLDGYLARRWNQVSSFGICFDPVVDKAFVLSALIALVAHRQLDLSSLPLVLIIIREMGVMGLRVIMLAAREWLLPAEKFGKLKSAVQFSFIFVATLALWLSHLGAIEIREGLAAWPPEAPFARLDLGSLFWIVGVFTVVSGVPYVWRNLDVLKNSWSETRLKQPLQRP